MQLEHLRAGLDRLVLQLPDPMRGDACYQPLLQLACKNGIADDTLLGILAHEVGYVQMRH